ncbi:MAG: hypothetical protein WCL29_05025 [Pseudomonadota bacterium]
MAYTFCVGRRGWDVVAIRIRSPGMTVASVLVISSASIILFLGLVHLLYTFLGIKLYPTDMALTVRMKEVAPNISQQTTMWRAWIGFNASHAIGAILFGAIYIYLAAQHATVLFQSGFLLLLGLITLLTYFFLGLRYWFSIPFRGITVSTALYVSALVAASFHIN